MRWGLALQELELEIHYQPGKKNLNADALSRTPVDSESCQTFGIVAALQANLTPAKDGDPPVLAVQQQSDPTLRPIMDYLTSGLLPGDDKLAHEIVLSQAQYTLIDGVLYHLAPDNSLQIVPPTASQRKLFDEAHQGAFGAHL